MDDIKESDWILASQIHQIRRPHNPDEGIDKLVSNVVGKAVRKNDPKLIKLVVKWKNEATIDPNGTDPYNFLKDKEKIRELRKAFNSSKTAPV